MTGLSQRTAVTSTAHVIGSTDTTPSSTSTGISATGLTTVATAAEVIGATHATASVGGATSRVAAAAKVIGATHTTASVGAHLPCVAAAAKVIGAANITTCRPTRNCRHLLKAAQGGDVKNSLVSAHGTELLNVAVPDVQC